MNQSQYEDCLETVYPGRWDIQNNTLYIHFPEVEITNSQNASTTIYNLFVEIPLNVNSNNVSFRDSSIYGFRTSYNYEQLNSNYIHSHLSSLGPDFKYPNSFCLGSGPIHASIITMKNEPNEEEFMFFLMQLNEFIKWESLEGVPYRYIRNIGFSGNARIPLILYNFSILTIINHPIFKPDICVNNNSIQIIKNLKFSKQFKEILTELYPNNDRVFFVLQNGKYESISADVSNIKNRLNTRVSEFNSNNSSFIFRQTEYPITITDFSEDNTVMIANSVVHPKIEEHFLKKVNNKLLKKYYNEYGTTTKTGLINYTKFII